MTADDPKRDATFAGLAHEKYGQYLQRYLLQRLRNAQDARELAQEVWTRLLRVDDPSRVREPLAYIRRTAANVLSEFRIRQEREPVTFDSEAAESLSATPLNQPQDELAEQLSAQRRLRRMLATLPPVYRQIILLRLCDGLSYAEIGERQGLTAATVQRYYFRAMSALRSLKSEP